MTNGPVVDLSGVLSVDLTQSKGALFSGSAADMIAQSTACYLNSGEIISYTIAELTAPYKYTVTPLVRGGYGTPILAHSIGEKFVRLDGTVAKVPYDPTRVGRKIWLKFLSFNKYGGGGQSLGEATAYTYTIGGKALEPEDVSRDTLDDSAIKDFVDAVNANQEATSAASVANSASAKVTAISTTLADNSGAIADLTTTVQANFNSLTARIDSTSTALANLNGVVATLRTTVTAQGVSITSAQTAISNINGTMSARYSLELNVSGRITGFSVFADQSGRSDFAVQADKFQIWATGFANKPFFEVGTIAGSAGIIINGRNFGDLSVLTDAIGNNAITNSAATTGAGDSGTCSLTVRTGSRILITAYYTGGGISFLAGISLGLSVDGTQVTAAAIPNANNGSFFAYYGVMAMYVTTQGGSSGTKTARAVLSSAISGNVTVYMQEMKK